MSYNCDMPHVQSRLDLLTARAWLGNNDTVAVGQVVDLSVATGVPCAFTRTIGFETTHANYAQMQQQQQVRVRE